MALRLSDKHGVLGWVTQQDGQLTGSTPVIQRLASQYQARHGDGAYARLALLDNGYVKADEQPVPG
jgi:hypothetical protein